MLVVEGRSQKSLKCKELIDNQNKMTLLINTTDNTLGFIDNKKVRFLEEPKDEIFEMIKNKTLHSYINTFPLDFKIIIFYINGNYDEIKTIKEFENEIKKFCVVTIQNDSVENATVKFL